MAPGLRTGEVIHGEKRGRDLGYPTANIRLDKTCGLKHGIYAVRVGRGQGKDQVRLDGVASYGRRPTFDNGAPLLEVFLFDFKGDLYGAVLDVAFIGFIREELKFDGIEALIRQMDDDSAQARAALAASPDAFPKLGDIGCAGEHRRRLGRISGGKPGAGRGYRSGTPSERLVRVQRSPLDYGSPPRRGFLPLI